MTDSELREQLAAKQARNQEQRLQAAKRWANHIKHTPVEEWGPELNALVNDQLAAAQAANQSAGHHQHVKAVASAIADHSDREADSDSGQ